MDYKYIQQLLERYWQGETSLEEEQILRAFFSQTDVPAELQKYCSLFIYEQSETRTDVLGKDFDDKMMAMIADSEPVKARVISFRQSLTPLFKAAAVVAIILTLSNAAQMSFDRNGYENVTSTGNTINGAPVALGDTVKTDSVKQTRSDIAVPVSQTVIE